MIPALFQRYGRAGFFVFLAFTLGVFGALIVFGNRPVWNAHWTEPYTVEVCRELVEVDPDALERVQAAYAHIGEAGQPVPTSIAVSDCSGPVSVRFTVGTPSLGRRGETRVEHEEGAMVSALVVLRQDALSADLYRHEAWHSIGAAHPWLPSSDHVLHPGRDGEPWGTATEGYTHE